MVQQVYSTLRTHLCCNQSQNKCVLIYKEALIVSISHMQYAHNQGLEERVGSGRETKLYLVAFLASINHQSRTYSLLLCLRELAAV